MGRSDIDDGESRRSSYNRRGGVHIDSTPISFSRPHSSKSELYSPNGTTYFQHPCGYHGNDSDDHHGTPADDRPITRLKSSSRSGGKALGGSRPVTPAPAAPTAPKDETTTAINAELKVSLATRQLAFQIKESKRFWIAFQDEFEAEVKAVKYYVNDDVLQRIWQKRTEHNSKYKNGENQDDEQFIIQKMKLETCMDQVKEAAKAFIQSHPLGGPSDHDPRHLALEKIQVTGDRVLLLAGKSTFSNIACADLVTQASDLEKLVDARSPDAKVLHRYDKRETMKISCEGEGEDTDPVTAEPTYQEQGIPDQETYGDGNDDEGQSATLG
ncbi:hypothetical protein F5Y00DRAFT_224417 [Daldinia vernicosa]|uniref:uncharacterized protein n=1 Tax=Daldinia vernicosa TaxID=114800 RepID=UPI002007D512|nr:uncharacterized protein F5Y00DRAFT_224417 [Daldinia vernicosa]KAI0853330.1 hypothetical protein F5Y00DRAFT_224417 [Daldinia vernicosa]